MILKKIENRTENWKTAKHFAPFLSNKNARLRLAQALDGRTPDQDIRIELFWYGIRDFCAEERNKETERVGEGSKARRSAKIKERMSECFARDYEELFGDLSEEIAEFELLSCSKKYEVPIDKIRLYNNLVHTEIDIVLESSNCLFIGEAKAEMDFGSDGRLVLVHQLIRQYVVAKLLICRLNLKKTVVPFVVGDNPEQLRKKGQLKFMICQKGLREDNVLSWCEIDAIARAAGEDVPRCPRIDCPPCSGRSAWR